MKNKSHNMTKKDSVNENKEKQTNPYPSATTFLNVIRDEYTKEIERSNSLDNKAGIFIAAIIAVLTIFVPNIPYKNIVGSLYADRNVAIITVFLCLLTGALILIVISFTELYMVIKTEGYKRPQIDSLIKENLLQQDENVSQEGLIEHYYEIVDSNENLNSKKAKHLDTGIIIAVIAFLLMLIVTIVLNFITA